MPVHDSYARITPFELLLPEDEFADRRFPLIQKEAEERKADLTDPERFALLSEAGAVLREIRDDDEDPRSIHQTGILLFHAFHFWSHGSSFFFVETDVLRYLTSAGPGGGSWKAALPGPAGYVQLPQHLVWVPGGDDSPPESVDGFFWSAPDGENISLLIAMGIRRDRPGLAVVPLPTLPLAAAGEWASIQVRPDGADFESSLPGAEEENLYSISAGAEAVKLAMRLFWYLDDVPGSVAESPGPTDAPGPRPSSLDARRVILREGD
jgi:hypothetical protein